MTSEIIHSDAGNTSVLPGGTRKKRGRPPKSTEPKTPLAQRLQMICGGMNILRASQLFGGTRGRDAVARYLRGDAIPDAATLSAFVKSTGCNGHWLLTGEGQPYQPAENTAQAQPAPQPSARVGLPNEIRLVIMDGRIALYSGQEMLGPVVLSLRFDLAHPPTEHKPNDNTQT